MMRLWIEKGVCLMSNDGHLYQPVVFYKKSIKVGFHTELLAYPFYSPIVFNEPAQATGYLSTFIKDMVESGDLPKEVIVNDKLDEHLVQGAVQEIIIGKIEKEVIE